MFALKRLGQDNYLVDALIVQMVDLQIESIF